MFHCQDINLISEKIEQVSWRKYHSHKSLGLINPLPILQKPFNAFNILNLFFTSIESLSVYFEHWLCLPVSINMDIEEIDEESKQILMKLHIVGLIHDVSCGITGYICVMQMDTSIFLRG